jgi:hypothetical protein
MKTEPFAYDTDIARQTAERQPRHPWPEYTRGKQNNSKNNENTLHRMATLPCCFDLDRKHKREFQMSMNDRWQRALTDQTNQQYDSTTGPRISARRRLPIRLLD